MGTKKVNTPKAYIICDQRRKRTNGTAPIRLIVKYEDKQKVYGLDMYLTQDDFDLTRKKYIGGNISEQKLKDLTAAKAKIESWNQDARDTINRLGAFTFDEFERLMFGDKTNTLFSALENKIADLNRQGRAGYANTYQSTLNSLKVYLGGKRERDGRSISIVGGKDIPLKDVTEKFLTGYKDWYVSQKRKDESAFSQTTIGIYSRNLRVIISEAIKNKSLQADANPFGKDKFKIPGGRKRKLALDLEDIASIMNADVIQGTGQEKYRDYWLFLYLAGGMNVTDMARLIYRSIDKEKISYERHKTALSKIEDPEFINIPLTREIRKIIDRWGQKPVLPEQYVFPILKPEMTPQEVRYTIIQVTKQINKYIKAIAAKANIEGKVTSYTARHSVATILRNSGSSDEFICEILGHSHVKVTKNYLKDVVITEKQKRWNNLIPKPKTGTAKSKKTTIKPN